MQEEEDGHFRFITRVKDLTDYKLPEELLSVPEIPRNGLGKIDRARLLEML